MRIKNNKKIEFFLKNFFFSKKYLFEKRIKRAIKEKEEHEIEILKELIIKDTDTIDVGVYRGVHSYEMSKYSNKVHAFEPNPVIYKDLENYLLKIKSNIKLYNYALSNVEGIKNLKIPLRNSKINKDNYEEYYKMGLASIHESNIFSAYETFQVKSLKLDNINIDNKISLIKIDVEGHELEVINGGIKLINKYKPNLIIEIEERHSKRKVMETINTISEIGYKVFVYNKYIKEIKTEKNLDKFNNFIFKAN